MSHDYCPVPHRPNLLNLLDLDALETSSVVSYNSDYFSRSESSLMSPPCGSVTELSDAGSCDTYQEYDVPTSTRKVRILT